MSFWDNVKKKGEKEGNYAAVAVEEAKAKAQEHKIVLGDAWDKSLGALPSGYKKGLLAGLGLTVVALGGAAFFAGRLARAEPEAANGLKKGLDLLSSFLAKTLAK